jgi:hypothetical protein
VPRVSLQPGAQRGGLGRPGPPAGSSPTGCAMHATMPRGAGPGTRDPGSDLLVHRGIVYGCPCSRVSGRVHRVPTSPCFCLCRYPHPRVDPYRPSESVACFPAPSRAAPAGRGPNRRGRLASHPPPFCADYANRSWIHRPFWFAGSEGIVANRRVPAPRSSQPFRPTQTSFSLGVGSGCPAWCGPCRGVWGTRPRQGRADPGTCRAGLLGLERRSLWPKV